mgnify:CR=1 FL=1
MHSNGVKARREEVDGRGSIIFVEDGTNNGNSEIFCDDFREEIH